MTALTRRALLAGSAAVAGAVAVPSIPGPAVAEVVTAAPLSRLKAFAVLELDEWTGGIHFAETEAEALQLAGVSEGEEDFYEVRREGWADVYADTGDVPAGAAAEAGWRFECCGCGRKISEDEDWGEDEEGNEILLKGLSLDGVLGTMDGRIFCTDACKGAHEALEARKAAVGARFVAALKERLTARVGSVEFVDREHTYVVSFPGGLLLVEEAHISFNFPGQKLGPATYAVRRPMTVRDGARGWVKPIGPNLPELSCCGGDVEAFNAWVGEELFQVPAFLKGAAHA